MTNGNLIGIGVDLLHVPRLAVELWVGEILTPAEAKKLASGKRDPILYLSTRISTKEAIYKALWPQWSRTQYFHFEFRFQDEQDKEFDCQISVSHDENFVVAFVVAMERESEGKSVMNQKT